MRNVRKGRGWLLLASILLCAFMLAGCARKYEAVKAPALEEAQGGLGQEEGEETAPVSIAEDKTGETETGKSAETSSHEATVTMETAPSFEAADETVYVTGSQVNIRKFPSADGEILDKLDKGAVLKRTGSSESWSRVVYKDKECYISSRYVSKDKPVQETASAAPSVSGNGTGKIIAIDAGHQAKGNSEKEPIGPGSSEMKAKVASGTQGTATGIPEYQLTLAVSLKLKQELINRGYQVYMIRETHDVNISNAERAQMADKSGADIFVRVHANSLNDSSVQGALTMCQTAKNPYNGNLYSKSQALSKAVVNGICNQTGFKNRGVQETDSMSGINWCNIPVTIVEMGFMSNADEDKKMATEEYRDKIVKGIADGIDAYYK
ncbi:N-acetylmuramoyl-L-alanine amidase [Lacrimispora sphenoides]|uniref:N-acetylmuramoyl-L-alanine amidase n=1 Tax=Lacrimispora sphenoides TaxID=29370 RepID=UPI0008C98C20|nr:N-acetylmuramoyl-L-alanine amidase [Lacrimispora sphenoides]SET99294.1 N-acetylmuramoyl-L-alanine amidase [Lacrimispora sphenoides]